MRNVPWRLCAWLVASALALSACGGGGSDTPTTNAVQPSSNNHRTTQIGLPASIDTASSSVVSVQGSTAQVSLPANGFVSRDNPSQAITGKVTVTLVPLDPTLSPLVMANGRYEAVSAGGMPQLLESFGAIDVRLSQGDIPVQLAPGQKATIRIPIKTLSAETPATIPLYYLHEGNNLWYEEGSATRKGNATDGWYYEGQVSHFTVWNADKPIEETVAVKFKCVQATPGVAAPSSAYEARSEGVDYSGAAWAAQANGSFTVLAKKNAKFNVLITSTSDQRQITVPMGPLTQDTEVTDCQDMSQAAVNSSSGAFFAVLSPFLQAGQLTLDAGLPVRVDVEPSIKPADEVCTRGSASNIRLNGQATKGGEKVLDGQTYTLATTFTNCAPDTSDALLVDNSDAELTGQTQVRFSYTINAGAGTLQLDAVSVLTQLHDESKKFTVNGEFATTLVNDFSNDVQTSTVNWVPVAGATIQNTLTGRTATIVSGSARLSTASQGFIVNKLTYKVGQDVYVIDGVLGPTPDAVISQSKNGKVIATMQGFDVKGLSETF
ncbi:MAG: hypothetical protein RI907_2706 [Pseudomonadota bacterium]|jgi:hypothetical protein